MVALSGDSQFGHGTLALGSRPCRLVSTKFPSTTESLNCAHSRVATVIMPSCPCQFFSDQAVHVLLSASVPGVSRPRPHLVTDFFSNLCRYFVSCDNHSDVSLFARPCHVCNRNGRCTFQSVFSVAAGQEPLIAFACALIMCRCRSSTNISVACMHCSRRDILERAAEGMGNNCQGYARPRDEELGDLW